MRFTKMQGAGNDFIIIDNEEERLPAEKFSYIAKRLCARRVSIGADGIMFVERPQSGGDIRMIFFNSDGTPAELCGNGARCLSRYGFEHGYASGGEIKIETSSGIVIGTKIDKRTYKIRLNDPTLVELYKTVNVSGRDYDCSYVELGVPGHPHAIVLLPGFGDIDESELHSIGSAIRWCSDFSKGANVTFCEIVGEDDVVARTFERGVEDFTLACGTGCGSTITALTLRGLVSGKNVKITVPGGVLSVTVTKTESGAKDLFLTGPTNLVAVGRVLDEEL
ncbi:MAG: diaminopimelate epimerase [Oscillospiraceae bacterium]